MAPRLVKKRIRWLVGCVSQCNLEIRAKDSVASQKRFTSNKRLTRRTDGRRGGNSKGKLALAAIVDREALEQERTQSGTRTATRGVKDEESLESGAAVGQLANAVEDNVNNLLSNGVVSTSIVVGSVLLAVDDLLRVVELLVSTGADFVADRRLEIDVDRARDVTPVGGLAEEGVEGVVAHVGLDAIGGGESAVGHDAVLQAVQLPALVSGLDSGLAEMDRDAF